MKNLILSLLLLFFAFTSYSQTKQTNSILNLNFEVTENGKPIGWKDFGNSDYKFALDSINVKNGKYAVTIEFNGEIPKRKAVSYILPNNYDGKKITLSGFIKTENVTAGYAGLLMSIEPYLAFDNMFKNGIKGTSDWTKYEITLDMNPEKTQQILIGGLLTGKGKMWMDDLKVTIDGKDIKDLKPFEKKPLPADTDYQYDRCSQIAMILLDKKNIENLKSLGLIWGFLKYYHPSIAKGTYNWDYELFRILPKILNSENKKKRDELLVQWISGLGQFTEDTVVKADTAKVKFAPDLDWIKHSDFSDELVTLLLNVKKANRTKEHYYIGLYAGISNPEFKNEYPYISMKYPDPGFRLLTLFRYWNIIQYYFPYKNLIEEDWKNVLEEFIPKIINAKNEKEYTLCVLELIARVHDTHANFWSWNEVMNHFYGINYAAVELTFIENKAVVTGFYNKKYGKESGMEIGDIITVINNETIAEIIKKKLKYTPASNYPTQLRNIAYNLLRSNDSIINIEFIRNDKTEKKALKTFSENKLNINDKYDVKDSCFRLINKDIAYINNGSLKKAYLSGIWKVMEKTKGLIIDIRNYPSDFPIYDLSNYLMPKSKAFVKITNCSIEDPGLFIFTKALNTGKLNNNYYKGKVIILVNENTQSSAEFNAMAYRVHPNAIVIGSTTAGADGNVSGFSLPGGISTMISGTGIYYPDGKETQRIGIVPDIVVKPTIQGIKKGQDELLQKAIDIINGH
ncbi:MAG: S41 family peptidase [Bacteroidetes bacterium]|nr:S41 family peptidase [Bacteroidota bacterium]